MDWENHSVPLLCSYGFHMPRAAEDCIIISSGRFEGSIAYQGNLGGFVRQIVSDGVNEKRETGREEALVPGLAGWTILLGRCTVTSSRMI